MESNKVKIICNPYEKTIAYKRWDYDDVNGFQWKDLGSNSKLIKNEEFSKGTIQHNAYEIVKELSDEYNKGGAGLVIVFEGTKEDYCDLKEVVERFDFGKDIKCEMGDYYIDSAKNVMPDIQNIFIDLVNVFDAYKSEDVKKIISQFLNATETIIPICVVGLYSSGKSAFINALIGEEILPSDEDPTTARIFKIMESWDKGEISFSILDEDITMFFEDDKYKITGNIEEDLCRKLHDYLENMESKSLTQNMYYSLKVINDYANEKKDTISQLITVHVPFSSSVIKNNQYKFIVFDTPGSDSESHKEHFHVLESALKEQTNGLPVLITTPKEMDKPGTKKLLEALNNINGKLDLANTMIIANQADLSSNDALKKKAEGSASNVLMKWKQKGIYFASAIMGIGSKKTVYDESNWMIPDYEETFTDCKDKFVKSENPKYKQLYKYNRIAKDRKDEYLKSVSGKTQERELLYINSGLHCIEQEIVEYAEKYALYNKCSQAQKYLEEAIDYTTKQIEKLKQEQEEIKEKSVAEMEEEKRKLLDKLKKAISDAGDEFEKNYITHMEENVEIVRKESIEDMQSYIYTMWEAVQENIKWGERVDKFLLKCESKAKEVKEKCRKRMIICSEAYCNSKREHLQKRCCEIVVGDENINDDEKKFLQQFIMDLKLPEEEIRWDKISADDVRQYFLFIPLDRINSKRVIELYVGTGVSSKNKYGILLKYIRKSHAKIRNQHIAIFKKWKEQLQSGLIAEMSKLNPKLREESRRIHELQGEIAEKDKNKTEILGKLNDLKELFAFKVRNKKEEAGL